MNEIDYGKLDKQQLFTDVLNMVGTYQGQISVSTDHVRDGKMFWAMYAATGAIGAALMALVNIGMILLVEFAEYRKQAPHFKTPLHLN